MKYFKLLRDDGVYWKTKNISPLLVELGLYSIERYFRNCYTDDTYWVQYGDYKYRLEKFKSEEEINIGMFKDEIRIDAKKEEVKPETTIYTENTIQAERIFTRKPQTLEEVQKMFGIDSKFWYCVKFTVSNWDVTSTKVGRTATNFAVKGEFKKRVDVINFEELKEKFINDVKKEIPIWESKPSLSQNNLLLEVPIADLHIGKMSWERETGENFDHHIAKERFNIVIEDILEKNKNRKLEKVLFVIGNDILNYDNMNKTTTGGTPQDTDIRFQKMFDVACELMLSGILSLNTLAPVDVLYVPSNHDYQTGYYLLMYISAFFKNHPNIQIDSSPKCRKYYEYGNNLICFSHGDKEKKRISGIPQVEAAEAWGRTKYREIHLGHYHSERTYEENGIVVRHLSSVTGTDSWHNMVGYVGAVKKAQTFIWSKEDGLLAIEHSIIKEGDIK